MNAGTATVHLRRCESASIFSCRSSGNGGANSCSQCEWLRYSLSAIRCTSGIALRYSGNSDFGFEFLMVKGPLYGPFICIQQIVQTAIQQSRMQDPIHLAVEARWIGASSGNSAPRWIWPMRAATGASCLGLLPCRRGRANGMVGQCWVLPRGSKEEGAPYGAPSIPI